jgi:hypothetical protein
MPYKDKEKRREYNTEYARKYRDANMDSVREYQKAYAQRNRHKYAAKQREWRDANMDTIMEKSRSHVYNLSDYYIRQQLGFHMDDIVPQDVIEFKRAQILLHRQLKKQKNATHENKNRASNRVKIQNDKP